ncbi:MAG TPA: FtsX-like permease family protein [Gaiellaceae bacterium]|nr:FtsX-like permease family protein [Gaiellaceae bacterium]
MIKVSLRGLAGRKLRAVLTGIAIVLGVAMISGTYILTDTINSAFTSLFTESYAGTDAVVSGRGLDVSVDGEAPPAPPVDASLLETVRGVDGVALATGAVLDSDNTKILDSEGKAVSSEGAPTFGFGIDTSPAYAQFNPLKLFEGRWPAAADEVVIDVGTADKQDYAVGDTVEISTLQPKRAFEIVGVAQYGSVDSLGNASFTVFTIPAAQELLDREGQYDTISVAANEGLSEDELVAAIEPALPASAKVVSATAEVEDQVDEVDQFTSIFRYFLLAFAGIALFVGAFVIFNTFSITVAQRTREFATLRTIGASRRQVLGSVVLESLVIGIVASLVGLGLGVLLAEGIKALFGSFDIELPTADRVFATRTVVVSLIVGVGITLLAGLFPAIRATRVPPIAAVREGATLPHSRFARFTPWIAALLTVGALLLLGRAMFTDELGTSDRLLSIAAGVLLLFLGVAMLSSRLVRPIAVVVGLPARSAGGAAGRLASGNAVRNPGRTAATAAALMIGIALVSFIATLTNGMKASNREAIEEQIVADYVVTSLDGYTPFVAAAGDALAASSVPELVTSVRSDVGQVDGDTAEVGGIEPDTITEAYRFIWKDGDDAVLATLGTTNAIVTENFADDHDISVGDTVTVRSTAGRTAEVTVVGTFEPPPFYPLIESINVSTQLFDSLYDRPRNRWTWANVAGEPSEENRAQMEAAIAGFPDTQLETREEWIEREDADFNEFISFLYVMLTLAVFVSIFGMINTLVLSVYERTREIGMLRAIGMTRRQVRRMIRQESIITALIGAALGLPLGIFLAALVNRALSEYDVRFAIPWAQLVVLTIVAIIIGVLAAIMPARRAAKLNPLEAISYE